METELNCLTNACEKGSPARPVAPCRLPKASCECASSVSGTGRKRSDAIFLHPRTHRRVPPRPADAKFRNAQLYAVRGKFHFLDAEDMHLLNDGKTIAPRWFDY